MSSSSERKFRLSFTPLSWREKLAALFAVSSLAVYLWLANILRHGMDFNDETEKLVAAEMIARGHHLYRDVFSQHGPMAFLLAHATFLITRVSNIANYRFIPILLCLGVCAALLWGPVLISRAAKYLSVGIFLCTITLCQALWSLNMGMYQSEAGFFFAIALTAWIVPNLLGRSVSRTSALCGGASLMCAYWTSYSLVVGCFFLTLAVVTKAVFVDRSYRRLHWEWIKWGCFGIVIAAAVMLLWLACFGDIEGYFIYHIWFNQKDYVRYAFEHGKFTPVLILKLVVPVWGYFFMVRFAPNLLQGMWTHSALASEVMYLEMWVFATLLFCFVPLRTARPTLKLAVLWILFALGIIFTNPRGAWDFHDGTMVVSVGSLMAVVTGLGVEKLPFSRRLCAFAVLSVACAFAWLGFVQTRGWTYIGSMTPAAYYEFKGTMRRSDRPLFKTIREIVGPDETIESLPYNPIDYIEAHRMPASGYFYAFPWQMDYLEHPVDGYKMDLCADLERTRPKVMFFDSAIGIWNFYADTYLSCVVPLLHKYYVKDLLNDRLWIRSDMVLGRPEILGRSLAYTDIDTTSFPPAAAAALRSRITTFESLKVTDQGDCLTVPHQNHDPLVIAPCDNPEVAQVALEGTAPQTRIVAEKSLNCLEVTGASTQAGQSLRFWPCQDAPNQIFEIVPATSPEHGTFRIRIPFNHLCVSAENGALTQADCGRATVWSSSRDH